MEIDADFVDTKGQNPRQCTWRNDNVDIDSQCGVDLSKDLRNRKRQGYKVREDFKKWTLNRFRTMTQNVTGAVIEVNIWMNRRLEDVAGQ